MDFRGQTEPRRRQGRLGVVSDGGAPLRVSGGKQPVGIPQSWVVPRILLIRPRQRDLSGIFYEWADQVDVCLQTLRSLCNVLPQGKANVRLSHEHLIRLDFR